MDNQMTHWPECWREQTHHGCAVAKVEDLTAKLAAAENVLRLAYIPRCKGYPTHSHMDSLEDDPIHGCDCDSCVVGRFLAAIDKARGE